MKRKDRVIADAGCILTGVTGSHWWTTGADPDPDPDPALRSGELPTPIVDG